MPERLPEDRHLANLQGWRRRPAPDLSMHFVKDLFRREVERPYKQLRGISHVWEQRVPAELARHTRLQSLSHGVLRVVVDSSARLYELDQLLRSGLDTQLIKAHKGPAFRRIRLQVGPLEPVDPPRPRPETPEADADEG